MSPIELAGLIITAATNLKAAGMTLEQDPSEDFNALATLVAIAYAENEQGENIGTGQSRERQNGKREVSFGPFQVNEFWYTDHTGSGDVTLVNNEYTNIFDDASEKDMRKLLQDPYNSAVAAVIIANSNKGYENWSTYNSNVYGIKDKDFDSKYWQAGFNSATEKFYTIEDDKVNVEEETVVLYDKDGKPVTGIHPDAVQMMLDSGLFTRVPKELLGLKSRTPVYTSESEYQDKTPVYEPQSEYQDDMPVSGLGQERREEGYSEREIASFKKGVEKIAGMMNKVNPQNPETIRQASLWLADQIGLDIKSIPLELRSNYDKVDKVILNFVGELGRAKAR